MIELDAAQKLGFAQAYYMNKKTGLQGAVRPSKEGGYNNNTAGDLRPFKQPDLNLLDFQSLFANANIRQGDAGKASPRTSVGIIAATEAVQPPGSGEG